MKRTVVLLSTLIVVLVLTTSASAATVLFQDNFNMENEGNAALNYSNFTKWNVSDGSVDLIGNGTWDYRPNNGLYVDMDGSTGNAGIITTKESFNLASGTYLLSFWLSGSTLPAYGATDTVVAKITVANFTEALTLNANDPFTEFQRTISIGQPTNDVKISFEGIGGNNVGLLLDNVTFSQVPLPPAAWLLGTGLIGFIVIRRKVT